jgi:hypothetical protein
LIPLLISLLAIVIAFLVYRKQPLQFLLRFAAILLIYLLITNTVLRIDTGTSPKIPAVLIDYSESMERHLPRILETIRGIDYPHHSFFFKESLLTENTPTRLGSHTNITNAMLESRKYQPSILMLITDGNHNFGVSPLTVLGEMTAPVYVYGVGAEKIRDAAIVDVVAPAYVYAGDSLKIEVVIESSGFPGGDGQVVLALPPGKTVAKQTFRLSDTPARYTLKFKYAAEKSGALILETTIPPIAGEASYENNDRSIAINVLKDRIKVLYYTDHVSFNTRFLRTSLHQDRNLSVSSYANAGSGRYIDIDKAAPALNLPDIRQYAVIILDNVNLAKIPWPDIPRYTKEGKGVILIGTLEGANDIWRQIAPINTTSGTITGRYQIKINETFSVLGDDDYPPVSTICRVIGSKQDTRIIAYAEKLPIIGYRREGRGVIYQICLPDLATWGFMQRALTSSDLLERFIGDIVRFVSPLREYDRLVLKTRRRKYAAGEMVDLTLQSYDRNMRRAGGGDFFLVADDVSIPFYETENGLYEASIAYEKEGRETAYAHGSVGDETLTSNTIEVDIISRTTETEHRLNRNLLERIAVGTNGRFLPLEELENTAPPAPGIQTVSKTVNFNSPLTYFLVLTLLVVDWLLRRRRGIT